MGPTSSPTSSKSWHRLCEKATLSLPITCPPTRSRAYAKRLKRPERRCAFCPPTRQISITIEQVFSKLKAALRKGAARTVTRLLKLIGRLAKTLSPQECANYFVHAGYGA